MSDKKNKTEKSDFQSTKLKQYDILMSYLQYENSSFWNRNNFFIVANTALLGFLIPYLLNICPPPSWAKILIPFGYCIATVLPDFFCQYYGEWHLKKVFCGLITGIHA